MVVVQLLPLFEFLRMFVFCCQNALSKCFIFLSFLSCSVHSNRHYSHVQLCYGSTQDQRSVLQHFYGDSCLVCLWALFNYCMLEPAFSRRPCGNGARNGFPISRACWFSALLGNRSPPCCLLYSCTSRLAQTSACCECLG